MDVRPGTYQAAVTISRPHFQYNNTPESRANAPTSVSWCTLTEPPAIMVQILEMKGKGQAYDQWADYSVKFTHPVDGHSTSFCGYKRCEGSGAKWYPGQPQDCPMPNVAFFYCDKTVDDHLATIGDRSPRGFIHPAKNGLSASVYDAFWDGESDPLPVTTSSILCPNSQWRFDIDY